MCSPGEGGNNGSHTGEGGERSDYCLVGSQRYRSAQKYVVRERGTVSDIIYTPETADAEAHTHTIIQNTNPETLTYTHKYKIHTAGEAYAHSSTNIFT